jgi:class 3 adenylate cyclase
MEPRIRYAKTSDGVSIAYSVMGEGEPLVHMPFFPLSHLQMEWQIPEIRRWYERLAETRMLVRYDGRGTGLSERNVTDFSLDVRMLDLEAVVDRLNLERFVLYGALHSGPVAIAYSVRHPERVSRLILWGTFARGSDWLRSAEVQATRALLDKDWQTYTETVMHALGVGWEAGEFAHRVAALYRESFTQQALQAFIPTGNEVDVTELLPQVTVATLVLHGHHQSSLAIDVARGLAAGIPDARLAVMERGAIFPYLGDTEEAAMAIDDFLREGHESAPREPDLPSGTAVILFADIVDSTALTERLGDDAFRAKARGLDEAMRAAIRDNGGSPVEGKTLGDGVLAVFTSAKRAIACAQACHAAASSAGLSLHAGIHAGDVIRESDPDGRGNVYGGAVNIAARVAAASAAGETLVSATVRELARTSAGVAFEDRGEQALKGIDDPVRVFVVRKV